MKSLRDGLRPLADSVDAPPDIDDLAAPKTAHRPRVVLTVGVVAVAIAALVGGFLVARSHNRRVVAFGPVGPRVTAPADQSSIGLRTTYACRADGRTVVTWTLTNHAAPTSIGAATTTVAGRTFRLHFSPKRMATGQTSTASLVTSNPATDTTIRVTTGDVRGSIGGKDVPTEPCTGGPTTTSPGPATGVVTGRLVMVGGPGQPGAFPVTGSVVAKPVEGGSASSAKADRNGLFTLVLRPGRYELSGASPQYGSGAYVCHADHPATVTPGTTTSSDVLCQMK